MQCSLLCLDGKFRIFFPNSRQIQIFTHLVNSAKDRTLKSLSLKVLSNLDQIALKSLTGAKCLILQGFLGQLFELIDLDR